MSTWKSAKARQVLRALEGIGWEVVHQSGSHKKLHSSDQFPDYVWARKETFSIHDLDIKALTDDAARRDYINPVWYLIAIEAGFELWEGGAGLATNHCPPQ